MTSRSKSYSIEEDMHLCHVYLDVSQDPIIGINQKGEQFWQRVCIEYEKSKNFHSQPRPQRSLQTRMTTILSAVSKLRGCVNQIENRNPSGASEQDILNQAKMLLTQYDNYKNGFKFDHVWPILKGMEKFSNNHNNRGDAFQVGGRNVMSSPSIQDESSPSPDMNSFDLNTTSEDASFNSSQRPMGVKKAKRKQQSEEQFKQILEQNDKLIKGRRSRAIIFRRRAATNPNEEHREGSQSQYHGSQYRASQNVAQGEHVQEPQPQSEDQQPPSDQQNFNQYYNLLNGNDFSGF